MEDRYLDRADPEKGRFRAFILTSLKFFLADEADRSRAQKRGGGRVLSFEISSGEDRYQREPAHNETPERIFERRAGRSQCSTESWTDSGPGSYNMDAWTISTG